MGRLRLTGPKMLKMIQSCGESCWRVGNGRFHSSAQGIGITLSSQVDNELSTPYWFIQIRR
jgi:hypothetical protein